MAKKEAANPLAGLMAMVKSADDALGKTGGIKIRPYSLQWVFDSELIRFGQVYVFYGPPSSGKSMGGYWMGKQFLSIPNGMFFVMDTENKTSLGTMEAIIGRELMDSGRCSYQLCASMNKSDKTKKEKVAKDADGNPTETKKKAEADDDEETAAVRGWMAEASKLIDMVIDTQATREVPVLIMIDSLLGAGTDEQEKKIKEAGGVVQGNETAAMRRAKIVSDWLETYVNKLAGTRTTLLVINHMSIEINMSTMPGKQNLPPKEKFVGGKGLHHRAAFHVKFKAGGDIKKADITGKFINITLSRNSFGDDTSKRVLTVPWVVDTIRGENNELRFDLGNNMGRKITWCWDLASANIIIDRCTAGEKSSSQLRSLFPGLQVSKTKGRVTCKKLGIDDVTLEAFGRMLTTNPEIRARTQSHIKLTVTPARDTENVYDPEEKPEVSSVERAHELGESLEDEGGSVGDSSLSGTASKHEDPEPDLEV